MIFNVISIRAAENRLARHVDVKIKRVAVAADNAKGIAREIFLIQTNKVIAAERRAGNSVQHNSFIFFGEIILAEFDNAALDERAANRLLAVNANAAGDAP